MKKEGGRLLFTFASAVSMFDRSDVSFIAPLLCGCYCYMSQFLLWELQSGLADSLTRTTQQYFFQIPPPPPALIHKHTSTHLIP